MLKNRYCYVAIFSYDKDGISIEFPDLPGCYPCADKEDGDEIPQPTTITSLHLESNQIAVLIDVFMPPVRERINNKFVKKTLSLPAWLAAKADEDGVNCSKIFQNALIDYLNIQKK